MKRLIILETVRLELFLIGPTVVLTTMEFTVSPLFAPYCYLSLTFAYAYIVTRAIPVKYAYLPILEMMAQILLIPAFNDWLPWPYRLFGMQLVKYVLSTIAGCATALLFWSKSHRTDD